MDLAQRLVTGWDQAVLLRGVIGVAGALILWLAGRALFRRSGHALAAVLWILAGLAAVAFGFFAQNMINRIVSTEYLLRVRIIFGTLSVIVLLFTLDSIRRTHLQERYALLWVATAFVILLAALFPHAVDLFRAVTGMDYVSAIVAVAFTFLVLVAFHFSIALSAIQSRESKMAQRVALLEARLNRLERDRSKDDADPSRPA